MRAVFGDRSVDYMRGQMKGWLDLSQRGLPSSLLLLSRGLVGGPRGAGRRGELRGETAVRRRRPRHCHCRGDPGPCPPWCAAASPSSRPATGQAAPL